MVAVQVVLTAAVVAGLSLLGSGEVDTLTVVAAALTYGSILVYAKRLGPE